MKFQSFLLFLFGVFAPVIAAAEYWISVASFKNRDSAESALVNAQVKSEQAFAVYGARTDMGYFFRVMAGPYPTFREAKRAQQTLSSNGLNGLDLERWPPIIEPGRLESQRSIEFK